MWSSAAARDAPSCLRHTAVFRKLRWFDAQTYWSSLPLCRKPTNRGKAISPFVSPPSLNTEWRFAILRLFKPKIIYLAFASSLATFSAVFALLSCFFGFISPCTCACVSAALCRCMLQFCGIYCVYWLSCSSLDHLAPSQVCVIVGCLSGPVAANWPTLAHLGVYETAGMCLVPPGRGR